MTRSEACGVVLWALAFVCLILGWPVAYLCLAGTGGLILALGWQW